METQRHKEHRETRKKNSVSSVPLCFTKVEFLTFTNSQLHSAELLQSFFQQTVRPSLPGHRRVPVSSHLVAQHRAQRLDPARLLLS